MVKCCMEDCNETATHICRSYFPHCPLHRCSGETMTIRKDGEPRKGAKWQ